MAQRITQRIRELANEWKNQIRQKARENLGDKVKLISVSGKVDAKGDTVSLTMTAGNKARSEYGDVKNVAHAYEYGSGIHGKSGHKYRIAPRRKKVLAFYWDVAEANPEQFVFAPDGRVLLPSVMHPGVQAVKRGRGYMKPAIDSVRRKAHKELTTIGKEEIVLEIRRAFKK